MGESWRAKTKKAHQVWSSVKFLLTVFCDCNGVVHHEFLPQGRTEGILPCSYTPIARSKHTHRCLCVSFWSKTNPLIMPQSMYSPDLAPADFFLFPKLKTSMKEKCFARIEEIKENRDKSCWRYQKVFRSVSRIGKNAGISILYLRGVTLKGTR